MSSHDPSHESIDYNVSPIPTPVGGSGGLRDMHQRYLNREIPWHQFWQYVVAGGFLTIEGADGERILDHGGFTRYYNMWPGRSGNASTREEGGDGQGSEPEDSTVSPAGGVLPVLYGQKRIAGLFIYMKVIDNMLHAIYLLGEGEFEEIGDVYINNKLSSHADYSGSVYIEKFVGTSSQTVCTTLQGVDATWTDTLPNIAYMYVRLQETSAISGLPTMEAVCKGKKVYDPRNELTAYSTNPALAIVDALTNTIYGGRLQVTTGGGGYIDWTSFQDSANYYDAVIGGAEKRFEFNYYFKSLSSLQAALDIMRLHCISVIIFDEGKYKLVPAKSRSIAANFVESEIAGLTIPKLDSQDTTNVVQWTYTDTTKWDSVEDSIEDPTIDANEEIHEVSLNLTGSRTYSQSKRIATYALNSRLSDLKVQFGVYNSKGLQVMDVFTVTHSLGLSAKQFYCTGVTQLDDGAFSINGTEEDPALYSENIEDAPTYSDTNLPDPTDIPDEATVLVLTESLEQARDRTWTIGCLISWTHSTFIFKKHYEVWLSEDVGASYRFMGITTLNEYQIKPLLDGTAYTIKIVTVSYWDYKSTGLTDAITLQGKYALPVWKADAALTATELGDTVFLKWYMSDYTPPATDIDIIGYELRRTTVGGSWDGATFIAFLDALVYQDNDAAAGTWEYQLKAKDSVGNYTDTAKTVSVTVTLNAYAGYQQIDNMSIQSGAQESTYLDTVLTLVGADWAYPNWVFPSKHETWAQRFDSAGVAWNNAGHSYPLSTHPYLATPPSDSGNIVSGAFDYGQPLGGSFSFAYTSEKLGVNTATITPYLLLSLNGVDYTEFNASSLFTGRARYVKVKFAFTSASDDTLYVAKENFTVTLNLDPISDYGEEAITNSQPLAVSFNETFVSVSTIGLTPISSLPVIATADNISESGFDMYLFDSLFANVAGTVKWDAVGF